MWSITVYHIYHLVWRDSFVKIILITISTGLIVKSVERNDRNENLYQTVVPKPDFLRLWVGHSGMATKPSTLERRHFQ